MNATTTIPIPLTVPCYLTRLTAQDLRFLRDALALTLQKNPESQAAPLLIAMGAEVSREIDRRENNAIDGATPIGPRRPELAASTWTAEQLVEGISFASALMTGIAGENVRKLFQAVHVALLVEVRRRLERKD